MIRARKKSIALFVTLIFLLSIMMPMAAFAGDTVTWTNTVNTSVTVDDGTGIENVLGYVRASIDTDAQLAVTDSVYVTVQLPDDVEYAAAATSSAIADYISGTGATLVDGNDKDTFKAYVDGDASPITINFGTTRTSKVIVDAAFDGNIDVVVSLEAVAFIGGVATTAWTAETTKTIGVVSDNALTVEAGTPKTIKSSGTAQAVADITFTENKAGAAIDQVITAELPDGFTWASAGTITGTMGLALVAGSPTGLTTDTLTITFSETASSPSVGSLKLKGATINVGPGSPTGDVEVAFTASSGSVFEATDVVVATVGSTTGTFTRYDDTSDKLYPGRTTQNVDGIKMKFSSSLSVGDQIWLELPEGAEFCDAYGTATNLAGKGRYKVDGDANRGAWFTVSTANDEYTMKGIDVELAADFEPGDLVIAVKGDVGPAEVVVGEVIAPFSVATEKKEVKTNGFKEVAGNITLTEAVKDAFISSDTITLKLSNDVKFSEAPKFKVNGGSEQKAELTTGNDNQLATLTPTFTNRIDTIEIYNIKYDVGTRVVGDVEVKIGGTAVNTLGNTDALAKVVNAVVGDDSVTAAFAVGDAGVAIVNGRTLVQVNQLCDVLGLQKSWDAATKTAYFVKDGKVVAFPMGENAIYISGVKVPVDQGGIIVNDYTYATLRGLEMAFGGELSWDADTKTATFNF